MARYNTSSVATLSSQTVISTPSQGLVTELVGSPPYAVTIPDPTIYYGSTQTFYNNSGGSVTLNTPNGTFIGPGSSGSTSLVMPNQSVVVLASDTTKYVIVSFDGGPTYTQTGNGNSSAYALLMNGDLVQSASTMNLVNTNTTTLNIGGAATSINIGASTGTTTINNNLYVKGGLVTVNSSSVLVEDKNIEIGYINPINFGSGTITTIGGSITGSTTFLSISGTKIASGYTGTVTAVSQISTSGSGTGATFNVTITGAGTTYTGVTTITINAGGSNYALGDTVTIGGSVFGGTSANGTNNLTFTIGNVNGSPWYATVTGLTTTTNLVSGSAISATNGTGSFGSGNTSQLVSSVPSGTSVIVVVSGGTTPVAGTVSNITPGSNDAYANGGGIKLYGSTNKFLVWTNTATGPLSANTSQPSWQTTEGISFNTSTASNFGIQTYPGQGTGFNFLTNGVTNGTVNIATDAVTGNLFTAGTAVAIGASTGTTTIRNTALTFNGTTVTMNSVTSLSSTASATWTMGSTFMYISSLGVGTATNPGGGQIYATSNITAYYSDDRLKTRLGNIENALEKLETLTGFYYEANETAQALGYEPVREVGVSAQDVQKILPEIVKPAPIDNKYMTIHYEKLTPLVIEAVKELSAMVKELKAKIDKE
jgi:hypothetical protein